MNDETINITFRCSKARTAFYVNAEVWRSRYMKQSLKSLLFKTIVLSILFYGHETWTLPANSMTRLTATYHLLAKRACNLRPTQLEDGTYITGSATTARHILNIPTLEEYLRTGRLRLFGQLKRGQDFLPTISDPASAPKRRRGAINMSWNTLIAQDIVIRNLDPQDALNNALWESKIKAKLPRNTQ